MVTINVAGLVVVCQRNTVVAANALLAALYDSKRTTAEEKHGSNSPAVKKPYMKPEFRFERAFETMALSCGKIRGTQALCRFNRKNS